MLVHTNICGTGNSKLSSAYKEGLTALNNKVINQCMIKQFFTQHDLQPCDVILSNRDTKNRWGTAWDKENRIVLYRHSIGIFLHELAHILNYRIMRLTQVKRSTHGHQFTKILTKLIDQWFKTSIKG